MDRAFVLRPRQVASPVAGCSQVEEIEDASVCFYGQKIENFLSLPECFGKNLLSLNRRKVKKANEKIPFRIYNIAGIPMMMKMADHRVGKAHGIDVVFDLEGQKPHDVVPGAFIAKKAGAVLKDLGDKEITFGQLEDLLLRPASTELRYVLAATEKLSSRMIRALTRPVTR
jgi:fructose-1,6-bisphosphatase/inositol monophosphatase family enzyme